MDSVVKKSLRGPIRKLTGCVSGVTETEVWAKRRNKRSGGGRGGCSKVGKGLSLPIPPAKDPSVVCSYQADLEKERKMREAKNAQKNAERASMRAHFRRKYQLSKNPKDNNYMRSVGGKVSLPCELAKMVHPDTKTKDDGYNLLSAFQGLGFSVGALAGSKRSRTPTPTPAGGDPCRVM
ncbi:complexin-3 [Lampris incognitus]|uniref:complexin-3 n=1 Tax=Lampris incognitus TaxID=2546036 RepID=UPI0024B4F214|nr:complexin-3 [Lampris incognitus]